MSEFQNRLAHEKSPYLLQHARNPVDWYPYGEEAFAKAKAEKKPIFLSIGYSTCHWCHVMEKESFENPRVAAVMNELFVNIKVDREERPDVDQIYMQAVMGLTGQGGWPLSVWLTPELVPFHGGTYFPPDARWGRPGFEDLLRQLAHFVQSRPDEVAARSGRILEFLKRSEEAEASSESGLPQDLGRKLAGDLEENFDDQYGGFGRAPKFPRPVALAFLSHRVRRHEGPALSAMLGKTLEMMWRGGIYDHVGGGFARYSTDTKWLVPHFEKMLYDNAQLIESYLDGHLLLGREDFGAVVKDVIAWVEREMTHPEGGFYSAQDADSEGEEGKFYVFSAAEIESVLGSEADEAKRVFGVSAEGNFEGHNILWFPESVGESAAALGLTPTELMEKYARWRCQLYGHREARVRPGLDDKVLTSWNGLMIAALARAAAVLGEPKYLALAERAAEFIEAHLIDESGELLRRFRAGESRFVASLDDYAALGLGYLALFQVNGRAKSLEHALLLAEAIEARFADPARGGYWFATPQPDLIVRMKESYDGAFPAGNSLAALLFVRLGAILDREDLRERGKRTVMAFRDRVVANPEAHPLLLLAAIEAEEPPRTLFVVGNPLDQSFRTLLRRAHRDLFPGRVIIPVEELERAGLEKLGVPLHGKSAPAGEAAAFLCENASCVPYAQD